MCDVINGSARLFDIIPIRRVGAGAAACSVVIATNSAQRQFLTRVCLVVWFALRTEFGLFTQGHYGKWVCAGVALV